MKTIFACIALIAIASALQASDHVGLPEQVEHINQAQDLWVAEENQFSGMTHDEIKSQFLGLIQEEVEEKPSLENLILSTFISVPDAFDARTQWSLLPIRDQKHCGSCWAFSAAEVLGDRFSIQYNTKNVLSTQDLVSCDKTNMACRGGYLTKTWQYLSSTGIVSDSCYPYTSGAGSVATCKTSCSGSGTWSKSKSGSYNTFTNVNQIKQEVYTNGPIQTGFNVYSDFMSYRSGIYVHTSGSLEGGHAVKIVGWGSEGGVDYWIVANSWNTSWGENGYFRIKMNQSGLNFESSGIAGKASQ